MTNTSIEVVLKILLLLFSNANLQFDTKELILSLYTATKNLPITKRVELIRKHKFSKMAFEGNFKSFIVYIATLQALLIS